MKFEKPLIPAVMVKKYKRFLVDFTFPGERTVHTASTNTTGPMLSCWEPGWNILLSVHENAKRKYPYALEMTHNGKSWIGVNTILSNHLVTEGIHNGIIKELQGYDQLQKEVKYGKEGRSKIDLLLTCGDQQCFVEVKCTNYLPDPASSVVQFPDTRSLRAEKHLEELIAVQKQGQRAVLLFLITREDCEVFQASKEKSPEYAEFLAYAHKHELVEVLAYQCCLSPECIKVHRPIPVQFPD